MSYLATAFAQALADIGSSQKAFAETAGLPAPQINRAARGTIGIGIKTAEAISRALPSPHDANVLVGWLRDQLSADRAQLVEVLPIVGLVTEMPASRPLPPLDDDLAEMLHWLAGMAARHTAVRDSLRALRQAVSAVATDLPPSLPENPKA